MWATLNTSNTAVGCLFVGIPGGNESRSVAFGFDFLNEPFSNGANSHEDSIDATSSMHNIFCASREDVVHSLCKPPTYTSKSAHGNTTRPSKHTPMSLI
jgi:hypothetical protein